jgi:2-polyprenyl-3-methyl-5-hydroxy-6-metoxy-1,4-benzoquinol methylase
LTEKGDGNMGTNKTLNELLPWLERTKRQDLYPTQLLFTDVLPWLQKLPADFDTILDIGCGPGFMSAFFYTRGHKVVACDPWDRFQFKDIIEYHKATAEVFKEKKFDAILLSHVLEHIPDVKTFMDEIKYLLNDNGYLFILLPVSLKVENGHWWQGWSLPQLGMHLAAHGFDCSKGIFQLCGNYSACGFGRLQKNMEFDINFNVKNMLSRLPKKFEDLIIDEGWGYSLSSNAIYILMKIK